MLPDGMTKKLEVLLNHGESVISADVKLSAAGDRILGVTVLTKDSSPNTVIRRLRYYKKTLSAFELQLTVDLTPQVESD